MDGLLQYETMSDAEREFIKQRYDRDMSQFKKFMNFFMIVALGIPIIFMVVHEVLPRPDDWNPEKNPNIFIVAFFAMLALVILVGYVGYSYSLAKLWADYEAGQKVVISVAIIKKYQDINGQEYFFQVNSSIKQQIMVSAKDFDFYEVGDEINIEYARHSKEFFSYF